MGGVAAAIYIHRAEADAPRSPLSPSPVVLTAPQLRVWSRFPAFRGSVPVLVYHGIDTQHNYLTVSRRLFEKQILALHTAGFHTVTIEQYARFVHTGSTAGLPSRPILITFDDGRVDSYRGADQVLRRYDYKAVMFVVAGWPGSHPEWALHWNEIVRMEQSGRWQIQEHAGVGHTYVQIDAGGDHGEFYAYREWKQNRLETYDEYKQRVVQDVLSGLRTLKEHVPGYEPIAFAVPYSNYGQRYTNDRRIAPFFLSFLRSHFRVVFDGDYLDEGKNRPSEIKGRWKPQLSYRIVQGPVMSLPDFYCRLSNFVHRTPLWREYACLRRDNAPIPSAHSD